MTRPYDRIAFALSLCLFVVPRALTRQQVAATPISGTALLQSSFRAVAGNTSISDVTLSGSAHRIVGSDDETGTVVLKVTSSGSASVSLNLSSGTRTETRAVSQAGIAGNWSGPDGVAHSIAYHNLMIDPGFFPGFTLASFMSSPNSVVAYVGQETRNGASVLHVSAFQRPTTLTGDAASLPQHLSQVEIYLDSASLLPLAVAFNMHPDDNALVDIPVSLEFSDYRSVNGVQVPFRVQKFVNYSLTLDLQLETARLNSGLSFADFSPATS